jgi:CheY-like chemotaxis protein
MVDRLDCEDRVIRKVQEPGGFGLAHLGSHDPKRTSGSASLAGGRPGLGGRRGRILFVEDDGVIAEMYRFMLESDGWAVSIALDGEDGLRQAVDDPPDLVLLDVLLPRLDGIEVLRRLRSTPITRGLRVLVISNASGLSGREADARALGIAGWVVKANTTPAALARLVAGILSN